MLPTYCIPLSRMSFVFFFRWNIVVHGGIDGYSRLVPYLHVITDNFASSAVHIFVQGLREFGVPSRIRVDGGSKFSHVRGLMEAINVAERNSAIVGQSVHNQGIERLWRDVYAKILDRYYKLFYHMEDYGTPFMTKV